MQFLNAKKQAPQLDGEYPNVFQYDSTSNRIKTPDNIGYQTTKAGAGDQAGVGTQELLNNLNNMTQYDRNPRSFYDRPHSKNDEIGATSRSVSDFTNPRHNEMLDSASSQNISQLQRDRISKMNKIMMQSSSSPMEPKLEAYDKAKEHAKTQRRRGEPVF